jgi:hypothetical protein
MTDWTHHPVFAQLTAPHQPFARHAVLHDMDVAVSRRNRSPGLAARVHHFVERGVPYFAPNDPQYREWAAKAALLWDELHRRSGAQAQPTPA